MIYNDFNIDCLCLVLGILKRLYSTSSQVGYRLLAALAVNLNASLSTDENVHATVV